MSGLEALQHLYAKLSAKSSIDDINENLQEYEIVRKNLTALEIIRNKGIHCGYVKSSENLSNYNANVPFREELTQEEYNLLKEVLL